VVVVAVAAALLVLSLSCALVGCVASRWRAPRSGPVGADAATAVIESTEADEDGPPADCDCEDCEDLGGETAEPPAPQVLPALSRRQVARRFAAIAATHPDLRCVERAVADLYLIPDERPQGRLL